MEAPSRAEILAEIQRMMNELFQLDPARVQPDARLIEDLDLDSLDAIDLAVKVEETTGLAFDEEKIRALLTVEDVIVVLQSLVSTKGGLPVPPSAPAPTES